MIDVTFDDKNQASLVNNKPFNVCINREQMYRRYQLTTDYSCQDIGNPLSPEDFAKTYGFDCEWPHKKVEE